jgi:hypothetical protein
MVNKSIIVIAFLGLVLFAGVVQAYPVLVCQYDAGYQRSLGSCERANLQCNNIFQPSNSTCVADLDEYSFRFLSEADADGEQTSGLQNLQILTHEPNSLRFCFSALISLGLCGSFHCVKKLSLGFIPEWYHEGGPFQIGHSHALMPGTLCPAQACCFIQPDCMEDYHLPRYFIKTVISRWRKSQFTPDVIISRGPPLQS